MSRWKSGRTRRSSTRCRAALARASTESISLPLRWWDALDEAAPEG